jgi:hypothetical protein
MTASGTRLASCELRRASPRIGGPDQHLDYDAVHDPMYGPAVRRKRFVKLG